MSGRFPEPPQRRESRRPTRAGSTGDLKVWWRSHIILTSLPPLTRNNQSRPRLATLASAQSPVHGAHGRNRAPKKEKSKESFPMLPSLPAESSRRRNSTPQCQATLAGTAQPGENGKLITTNGQARGKTKEKIALIRKNNDPFCPIIECEQWGAWEPHHFPMPAAAATSFRREIRCESSCQRHPPAAQPVADRCCADKPRAVVICFGDESRLPSNRQQAPMPEKC